MKKRNVKKCIAGIVAAISVVSSLNVAPFAATLSDAIFTKKPEVKRIFTTDVPSPTTTPSVTPLPTPLIKVNEKKSIQHTITGEFTLPENGKNEKEVVFLFDISGIGNGSPKKEPTPFDSALFSGGGQNLLIQGQNQQIIGPIHSNGSVYVKTETFECYDIDENGNKITQGIITSAGDDSGSIGKMNKDSFSWNQPKRPMPDYSNKITESPVAAAGAVLWINDYIDNNPSNRMSSADFSKYLDQHFNNYSPPPMNNLPKVVDRDSALHYLRAFNPYTKLLYRSQTFTDKDTNLNVTKEYIFPEGGTFVVPDDTILRIGNNFFSSNSITFEGTGYLVVDGEIRLQGTGVITSPKDEKGEIQSKPGEINAGAFIYSTSGSVYFETNNIKYYGAIYAPNGKVSIQGGDVHVYGSVVAKDLGSIPKDLKVTHTEGTATDNLQPAKPKTYFELAKESVKKYIDSIDSSDPVDIHLLTYNDRAYDGYSGKAPDDGVSICKKIDDIEIINNGSANLGDGIRKATNILNNKKLASKSIVVISGSSPNWWTKDDAGGYYLGVTDPVKDSLVDTEDEVNGYNPKGYAESAVLKAAKSNIVTLFFNYLPKQIPDPTSKLQNPPMIDYGKWIDADDAITDIVEGVIKSDPRPDLFDNLKGIDKTNIKVEDFYKSAEKDDLTKLINDTLSSYTINYLMEIETEFYCLLPIAVKVSNLPSNLVPTNNGKRTKITSKKRVNTTLIGQLDAATGMVTYSIKGNNELDAFNMNINDLKFMFNKDKKDYEDKFEKLPNGKWVEERDLLGSDAYIKVKVIKATGYNQQNVVLEPLEYKTLPLSVLYTIDLN